MGMVCNILGLSPDQIAILRAQPRLVHVLTTLMQERKSAALLESMNPDLRAVYADQRRSLAERSGIEMPDLGQLQRDAAALGKIGPALDLDKSWHVLHYLFTSRANATGDAESTLLGGEPIGDDLGYGPARLSLPNETAAFDRLLASLDVAALSQRSTPEEMRLARIYAPPPDGDELQTLIEHSFPQLKTYVREQAKRDFGLLIWLT